MPPELTATRLKLLSAVLKLGAQANLTNVARELGVTREAVRHQAGILRGDGYLLEQQDRYTPLQLTDKARRTLNVGIPIYGQIAAGFPILAEQNPDDVTPTLEQLLGMKEGDFLLRVKGDSMIGIGVMDGDYVIVRRTNVVQEGEIAVVLIPGENTATLKRFHHWGDEVILTSENPELARMTYPSDQVLVQGRMIGRVGSIAQSVLPVLRTTR